MDRCWLGRGAWLAPHVLHTLLVLQLHALHTLFMLLLHLHALLLEGLLEAFKELLRLLLLLCLQLLLFLLFLHALALARTWGESVGERSKGLLVDVPVQKQLHEPLTRLPRGHIGQAVCSQAVCYCCQPTHAVAQHHPLLMCEKQRPDPLIRWSCPDCCAAGLLLLSAACPRGVREQWSP